MNTKINMQKVLSSNINFVGRSDSGITVIEFKAGARYRYDKIPDELYKRFMESKSMGRFMHTDIKKVDMGKKINFLIDEKIELKYPVKKE